MVHNASLHLMASLRLAVFDPLSFAFCERLSKMAENRLRVDRKFGMLGYHFAGNV